MFCYCFEESGLYAYKIFGTMDVPAETCAKTYVDMDYRKVWDPYVRGMVLSHINIQHLIILFNCHQCIVVDDSNRIFIIVIY